MCVFQIETQRIKGGWEGDIAPQLPSVWEGPSLCLGFRYHRAAPSPRSRSVGAESLRSYGQAPSTVPRASVPTLPRTLPSWKPRKFLFLSASCSAAAQGSAGGSYRPWLIYLPPSFFSSSCQTLKHRSHVAPKIILKLTRALFLFLVHRCGKVRGFEQPVSAPHFWWWSETWL